MNKTTSEIAWPANMRESVRLLRSYMLKVVEHLEIPFGPAADDPVAVVKGVMSGDQTDDDRRAALERWWKVVDERGIRDFQSNAALVARVAVCLLSPSEEEKWDLGEQLQWFLKVLGTLGADIDNATLVMSEHFDFIAS